VPTRDTAPVSAPCWIELSTNDTDKSRAFYEQLFGWTSEAAGEEYGGYINFSKDGVRVAGCMANDGSQGATNVWLTYLASDDAKRTADDAAANGATVIVPAMDVMDLGRMAVLVDPGGAVVGVWEPGTHQGFGVLGEPNAPSWFELHTRDFQPSVDFYKQVFKADPHSVGDTDEFRYTTLNDGEEQVAGIMDAAGFLPAGDSAHWDVYFNAADVDQALDQIVKLGGAVVDAAQDTPYGRLATATDTTGTRFRLQGPNVA
jgi:predicted enzyme related to lactoylglutathione lyase